MANYTDGLFYNEPHQNAPDFVLGSLNISKARFLNWLDNQAPNDKDYVKIDIKRGKDGKPYCELNTWQPTNR
jgi:hypothetical protein